MTLDLSLRKSLPRDEYKYVIPREWRDPQLSAYNSLRNSMMDSPLKRKRKTKKKLKSREKYEEFYNYCKKEKFNITPYKLPKRKHFNNLL